MRDIICGIYYIKNLINNKYYIGQSVNIYERWTREKYHLNFGVYYTPAESLAMTSYDKFLKKYKLIENVTAFKDSKTGELKPRGYFTNSIHVPVWEKISPFQKIDCESQLVGYSSAGCITYVEIGDNAEHNLKALMHLVLYAKAKDITYFAVNVPISECTNCGYNGHIKFDSCCPKCGAEIKHHTIDEIVASILKLGEGTKIQIMAPIARGKKGEFSSTFEELRQEGFVRVKIDGEIYNLDEDEIKPDRCIYFIEK